MTGQLALGAPFAGVLVSFALLSSLAPRFWHRRMTAVMTGWIVLALLLQSADGGVLTAANAMWQMILGGYTPFVVLLLALYALGGGIMIKGGPWGRPGGNVVLLAAGTLLASVMGTTGAALLLIHPLLAANARRPERRHLVLAFIILVGNAGGALSPLGDPPLLVGFLHGVPFFWPLERLWLPLLLLTAPVLALTYAVDRRLAGKEPPPPPVRPLKFGGGLNVLLLLALLLAVPVEGLWHPGDMLILGAKLPIEQVAVTLVAVLCIALSEALTPRAIRAHNRFAWQAMREIVIVFFAIFATIEPVFVLLQQAKLVPAPALWFWTSGIASAVLDAAPTYLIFFQAAGGNAVHLAAAPARLLTAIAAGSVFFGPITYLGNAPNLMIRDIAAHRGVRMPGFFSYAIVMILVLTPVYLAMTLLFF